MGLRWLKQCNCTELKAYFGILIILGINPVKQYQMAFSSDPFLGKAYEEQ